MLTTEEAVKIIEEIKTIENGQDACLEDFARELRESNMDIFSIDHLEDIFANHQSYWCYENNGHFTTMTIL